MNKNLSLKKLLLMGFAITSCLGAISYSNESKNNEPITKIYPNNHVPDDINSPCAVYTKNGETCVIYFPKRNFLERTWKNITSNNSL